MPEQWVEEGFVRGAALPHWARPQPLPPLPPSAQRAAVWVRLADTQLWAGSPSACLIHRAEQVNDPGALSQVGQVSVSFNPRCQRLLLHRLQVLRGEEVLDHTATLEPRLLQREAGLEQGVVSGLVSAVLVVPDLRVGDTLELLCTIEGENPIFEGRYAGWAGWDQHQGVQRRHVCLVAPEGRRRIHWQWVGELPGERPEPVEQREDGLRRLTFAADDLPPVPFEPYLPRDAQPLRWLQFTEFERWSEVADWALRLFPLDASVPQALDALLQRLRALPTPEAQVSQALQWVQSEIRYHSLALGEGSHRPRLPDEVVQRRYGDCKDKSLLLSVVLRALGLDARPALVSAQTRAAPLALRPSPEAFDHVIVRVRLHGEDHFVDPTRHGQSGPLDWMGQGLEDAAALVVAPGSDALVTVRSRHREQLFGNELHERYAVERLDGEAHLLSEQHWHGLGAESLRAMLVRMDEAQLGRWALGRYERRHPGLILDGVPEVAHDSALNRLSVRARYRIPRATTQGEHGHALRWTAANLLGAFVLPESLTRRLPLAVPAFPGRLRYRIEVHWPEGVSLAEPPAQERLETEHFQLGLTRGARGAVARHTLDLLPLHDRVPAHAVPQLAQDLRRLDAMVHGQSVAPFEAVQPSGPAGATRLAQRLSQPLRLQAERTARAIARGHLQGEDLALAHALRAEALAALGDGAAALTAAQQAVAHGSALPQAWAARAAALAALERFDEAARDLGRALQLDGDPHALHLQRGQAHFCAGRFGPAADDLSRAAALAPDEPAAAHAALWQGWALRRAARPLTEALQAQARTGLNRPWPGPALALLGSMAQPEQVLDAASSCPAAERDLAWMEAWFSLGQHHLLQGRHDAAAEAFEHTRQAALPRHAEPRAAAAELLRLAAAPHRASA